MRRIESRRDCDGYTLMKEVLINLELDQKDYLWLITDMEACPQNSEIDKLIYEADYLLFQTKELLDLLNKEDFQWIWGVFSAIPSKYSKDEILKYPLPFIQDTNPLIDESIIQHPLADFELWAWDSSAMFLVTDNDELIKRFKKYYPKSIERYQNLRIKDNLKSIEENKPVAFKAKLICDCGCQKFKIYHTGKQTKGIVSPYLVKLQKQIEIDAVCRNCGNKIIILDTTIDGTNPYMIEKDVLKPFVLKNQDEFLVELSYNYWEKDYMTNQFVDCFIDVKNDDKKPIRIYE